MLDRCTQMCICRVMLDLSPLERMVYVLTTAIWYHTQKWSRTLYHNWTLKLIEIREFQSVTVSLVCVSQYVRYVSMRIRCIDRAEFFAPSSLVNDFIYFVLLLDGSCPVLFGLALLWFFFHPWCCFSRCTFSSLTFLSLPSFLPVHPPVYSS